ncbi:hypothetical protein GJ744_008281 [Endocarpon pusillum]|uniref:Uncharacterized protein n=1 Tax=Endocarpon pusillum TaxID=364733 RepID=A0A8H7ALD9_9EURO|nr:hypothetical protein GJ744_008281 [Endocarpon pusillum]
MAVSCQYRLCRSKFHLSAHVSDCGVWFATATIYRLKCCPVTSTNRDGYEHDRDGHNPLLEIGARTHRVFLPS